MQTFRGYFASGDMDEMEYYVIKGDADVEVMKKGDI